MKIWDIAVFDLADRVAKKHAVTLAQGYVARLVQRLASLLGVPLRYPLRFANSRSSVFSHPLPAGSAGCATHCEPGTLTVSLRLSVYSTAHGFTRQ